MKTTPSSLSKVALATRTAAVTGAVPRLTRRDLSLFVRLWRFGVLLRDQIHALCFDGCARRRCNRRLKILADAGLIVPFELPLGIAPGSGLTGLAGSTAQSAYRLGAAAIPFVAGETGADIDGVDRRVRQGSPTYVAHALAVAQVAVAFEAGLRETDGLISGAFQGESEARHAYQFRRVGSADWETAVVKPDALVRLHFPARTLFLFLEVDLGHMSPATWREKADQYLLYEERGALKSRYGRDACYSVLTITTTPERLGRLLYQSRDAGAGHLFRRGTTLSELFAAHGSAPVWYSAEDQNKETLQSVVREPLRVRGILAAQEES